jgi:hypothetical protein
MKVAIIGGGAAGFFSAICVKTNYPNAHVIIYEKSQKLLSKVKVSGGGRCNVTNGCRNINELCKAYPRGGKKLKSAFNVFNTKHIFEWFQSKGVPLSIEDDGRVFPKSNNSQSIIDCFMKEISSLKIDIKTRSGVKEIKASDNKIKLVFLEENNNSILIDKVIIACGGSPTKKGLLWLEKKGHKIIDPVPSLFTFNIPKSPIIKLMGVVAKDTLVNIQGTKLCSSGPLLITHWGMSGPAILKLSSFGARILNEKNYDFNIQLSWINEKNNELIVSQLKEIIHQHPKKTLSNTKPFGLPERLWVFLLNKSDIPRDKVWGELGKKHLNKLVTILSNDTYNIKGKTTFKDEFVTCGGVSLESINMTTMQSKVFKNLYFAGEVLDIDAITGGYNFQAAWTTGFIAGKLN